jgi:hypothetical protein
LIEQRRQVLEYFAHPQLGIEQPERSQTCGIQGMPDLTGVLQDQYAGTAFQARNKGAQAVGERAGAGGADKA